MKSLVDRLLDVPAADPEEAQRRRLLNVLLLSLLVLVCVGFLVTVLGFSPPSGWQFYLGVLAVLFGAAIIFLINRYGAGRLARWLFLIGLVVSGFISGPDELTTGRGLLTFAVPIVVASFLVRPYVSLVMAGLISLSVSVVMVRISSVTPDVWALALFFALAGASWLGTRALERAFGELRVVNRELDRRVNERSRDLQRRSMQLQAASEVARGTTEILDVQKLLDETVHLISQEFDFYHAAVFLIDREGEYAVLRAASSKGGRRMLEQGYKLKIGEEGTVGHVADTREPLVVLDVGREAAYVVNPELPDTRSEMALPLISREQMIGVLDVRSIKPNIFTTEDVAALQTMADQLANAIENARLYEAEQQRRQEAETLYRATQAIAMTLDLREVFEHILSELQRVVDYDSASVQLLRDNHLEIIGGHGFSNLEELLGTTFDLSVDDSPNAKVVRRRDVLIMDDAPEAYDGFSEEPHASAGTRSWLGVPLLLGDRLIGMLALDKQMPGFYTAEHARLASAFAAQAAIAIENAGLYEEIKRHVEELTALHAIDLAMISTVDLDEVLSIVYEHVGEILNVSTFYIALYDRGRDKLHIRSLVEQGERRKPFTLQVGEDGGLAEQVVRTRQPLWVEDAQAVSEETPRPTIVTDPSMRSIAVLPLIVRDQVVGVISVQSSHAHAFDENDRQLLSSIAYQTAIAVTNAKLYEEIKCRLDEAGLVQEVMLAAASTLDFDLVLERAIKALHRALGIDRLGFLLLDELGDEFVLHPSLVGFAQDAPRIPVKGSLVGHAYRTGRSLLMADREEKPGYICQSPDVYCALAVPVRIGDRVAAVLLAESAQPRAFGEDEMRVFTTIAGQLGVALENARLYQEMTRHTHDLRLLAGASAGMIGSLKSSEIVAHLLNALIERFHSPCFISLMEPDEKSVVVASGWLPDTPSPPVGHRLEMSELSGLDQLMQRQQLVYVTDVGQDEWKTLVGDVEREAMRRHNVQAGLVLPMLSQEGLVGVASVGLYKPLTGQVEEQLDWAQALVNQAAVALGNAWLYQRLETQATELAQAYRELQEIDRLRTQLVQNVGHELRTPLSLIKGYVELLLGGDLGAITDGQRDSLQVIRERTATLVRLIHNLTMLQPVPREALDMAPTSMIEIVQQVLKEFQHAAEASGILFRDELPAELPLVMGDRERLELVLGHLVDNAIKFSPDGGAVTFGAWIDGDLVNVSVADEGIGISPASLDRVFERFYQVDGSTRRRYGGMGIGLALVWEIIQLHGGDVHVESRPGKGSRFVFSLPSVPGQKGFQKVAGEDVSV